MDVSKRKRLVSSGYDRKLLRLMDLYAEETGVKEIDFNEMALWAEGKHWNPSQSSARKKFARELARAASRDFIEDEDGEPVRRRLSYTINTPRKQGTFWKLMEDMSPEEYRTSAQVKRRRMRGEVLQADRDTRYFNNHYNPGDAIQLSWNFDLDVEESRMPTEYPDVPPEDDYSD